MGVTIASRGRSSARWRFIAPALANRRPATHEPNRRAARGQAHKSPWPNAASAARRCRPNRNARAARSTPRWRSAMPANPSMPVGERQGSETAGGERQRRNPPRRCGAGQLPRQLPFQQRLQGQRGFPELRRRPGLADPVLHRRGGELPNESYVVSQKPGWRFSSGDRRAWQGK